MCGRFTLRAEATAITKLFGLRDAPRIVARYNVAPTQEVGCVLPEPIGVRWTWARWGLLVRWQSAPGSRPLINARSESVSQKPSFQAAFQHRRCLIPCDGFFEWQVVGGSARKQPWWITIGDGELSAFAGLYEIHKDHAGISSISCCVLTTVANALVAPVHDRMPVLVDRANHDVWLRGSSESARQLLRPHPAETMRRVPVGFGVGNPRHESADCVVPAGRPIHGNDFALQELADDETPFP